MAAYGSSLVVTEVTPNAGLKTVVVLTPALATEADTLTLNLNDYGIQSSGLISILGVTHSGAFSVLTMDLVTKNTCSSSGVLTIYVASPGTGRRAYTIVGKSN